MTDKKVEAVIVEQQDFEVWDEEQGEFVSNHKSNFYVINALGQFVFFLTRDRAKAQKACDELYGVGRYTIRVVKDQKSKSKLESGGLSCSGSTTRKCTGAWLKKS